MPKPTKETEAWLNEMEAVIAGLSAQFSGKTKFILFAVKPEDDETGAVVHGGNVCPHVELAMCEEFRTLIEETIREQDEEDCDHEHDPSLN